MISAHAHAKIFKYEETALSHGELQKQYYCHFKVKSKCRPALLKRVDLFGIV